MKTEKKEFKGMLLVYDFINKNILPSNKKEAKMLLRNQFSGFDSRRCRNFLAMYREIFINSLYGDTRWDEYTSYWRNKLKSKPETEVSGYIQCMIGASYDDDGCYCASSDTIQEYHKRYEYYRKVIFDFINQ